METYRSSLENCIRLTTLCEHIVELVILGHYLSKYDDCEFSEIVHSGDKSKGTDIHTVNQHRVGLPTRDLAKTLNVSVLN